MVGLPNEVHPGLISEVVPLAVAPPDALLLYIHRVQGHSYKYTTSATVIVSAYKNSWPVSRNLRGRLGFRWTMS